MGIRIGLDKGHGISKWDIDRYQSTRDGFDQGLATAFQESYEPAGDADSRFRGGLGLGDDLVMGGSPVPDLRLAVSQRGIWTQLGRGLYQGLR